MAAVFVTNLHAKQTVAQNKANRQPRRATPRWRCTGWATCGTSAWGASSRRPAASSGCVPPPPRSTTWRTGSTCSRCTRTACSTGPPQRAFCRSATCRRSSTWWCGATSTSACQTPRKSRRAATSTASRGAAASATATWCSRAPPSPPRSARVSPRRST
ncbi:MAG: hypothetical protein J3K34DRAFT_413674 [Monoraphidium minutum]|nr:MAG: hypothetical protein J3K34DRAFT_413674 [Monoraphidium minutum]